MVKLNYNKLHKLSKYNYIKRPEIAVLYYDIDKTIKFTNTHILFILNDDIIREKAFSLSLNDLYVKEFRQAYPTKAFEKIIARMTEAEAVKTYNITLINNNKLYIVNEKSYFDKDLVDTTIKAVGFNLDYFLSQSVVGSRHLLFKDDEITILILGVIIHDKD